MVPGDLSLAQLPPFPEKQTNLKVSALGNPGRETRAQGPPLCQGLFVLCVRVRAKDLWEVWRCLQTPSQSDVFKCIKYNTQDLKEN